MKSRGELSYWDNYRNWLFYSGFLFPPVLATLCRLHSSLPLFRAGVGKMVKYSKEVENATKAAKVCAGACPHSQVFMFGGCG